MAKWPQGALPCLPLSGIHRPPCRGRHRYAGFEGCRTLSEWSYRTMWQRQKISLILSVKHGQRSASEKKNEPYFLMAAWKVCSIRSMGCCWQRPWRMFDLSPLLLWSEEKLCSWAVSPCLRNTRQRRVWRELAKGLKTKNIQPSEIPLYRCSWMVRLMAATNEGAARKKQELWTLAIYIGVILPLQFQSQSLNMRKSILSKPFI